MVLREIYVFKKICCGVFSSSSKSSGAFGVCFFQEIMPWSMLDPSNDNEATFDVPENEAFGFPKPSQAPRWKPSGT